ncbi:MAG: glutamate ligase domain-containing protein, partial [Desulfatiglandales bacterium]
LQRVSNSMGINIFVDYAHTPDALQSVISNLRRLSEGRLIVVFGCGGDRDKGKRPMMGQIAVLGADEVFITSDNPRSEDPLGIIEEILVGIRRANTTTPYTVEPDREKAIGLAIARARRGDTVLIAGKGHEDYQIIKDRRYPFSDVGVAERIVSQMEKS